MFFPVVTYGSENWTIKRAEYERIDAFVVLEKTPESSLDSKELKPINLKGNEPKILIGRTNAEADAPVFWSPDENS